MGTWGRGLRLKGLMTWSGTSVGTKQTPNRDRVMCFVFIPRPQRVKRSGRRTCSDLHFKVVNCQTLKLKKKIKLHLFENPVIFKTTS